MPLAAYFYDGAFQERRELETLELTGGTMWSYVFKGCVKFREIRFSRVDQLSTQCFAGCPALTDIWIANKTVAQTMQVVPGETPSSGARVFSKLKLVAALLGGYASQTLRTVEYYESNEATMRERKEDDSEHQYVTTENSMCLACRVSWLFPYILSFLPHRLFR